MPDRKWDRTVLRRQIVNSFCFGALMATWPLCAQDKLEPAPSAAPAASAPTTSAGPVAPAGLVNGWLRQQSDTFNAWDLGGQFRIRYEVKDEFGVSPATDFRASGVNNDNDYLLLRERLHLGYTPIPWVTAFVEGQNNSTSGDARNPNPESDGPVDLHQGYLLLGDATKFPVLAKVGRQELLYGDERLIGAYDWNNNGRVFDAAKLRWQGDHYWVDAFSGHVVLPDDNHFDEPNDQDWFSGVYASTTLIPKMTTDVYFLSRNVSPGSTTQITTSTPTGGASPRDIYTVGLRFKSLPGAFRGWDYEGEFAGQFGRFKATATSASLDQQAFAAHAAGGYSWAEAFGAPRLGLEYNFSSGDSDPNDGKHETFDNLFPTNHKFYGYMDFVSWENIHNLRLTTSLKPLAKLTLTADYHAFWLADTHDYFYTVAGAPRKTGGYGINPAYDSYLGSEIDLVASYAIKSFASMQIGYGHFLVGNYVKSSLAALGDANDADWFYCQATFNF